MAIKWFSQSAKLNNINKNIATWHSVIQKGVFVSLSWLLVSLSRHRNSRIMADNLASRKTPHVLKAHPLGESPMGRVEHSKQQRWGKH